MITHIPLFPSLFPPHQTLYELSLNHLLLSATVRAELKVTAPPRLGPLVAPVHSDAMLAVEVNIDVDLIIDFIWQRCHGLIASVFCV